jgi:2-polyprenyl-3-methyl-5-hydroxy-6-metoxy-1,4-benzoquinol methylase
MKKNQKYKGWKNHRGTVIDSVKNYDVINCLTCGFKHVVPIPTNKSLENYYKTKFYGSHKPNYLAQHKKNQEWWQLVYKERYSNFSKLLNKKAGRILDIGCGHGLFMHYGEKMGWDVTGVEPSQQAVKYVKSLGLKVYTNLQEININNSKTNRFDVVYSNQTFEHLTNPKKTIKSCFNLLKPSGIIFICVANDYNPIQKILAEKLQYKKWWLVPPEHINYFNIKSLTRLIKSSGFKVLNINTTFPIDLFLLMGDNYLKNKEVGKRSFNRIKKLELNLSKIKNSRFKEKLYHAFCKLDIGRKIEIYAQKNNL